MKDEGKVRFIGFSFWETVADAMPKVEPWIRDGVVECAQVKFNLLWPEPVQTLFPIVRETGLGVVAREALGGGFLTDAVLNNGSNFHPEDKKSRKKREDVEKLLQQAERFKFLCSPDVSSGSLAAAALNWTVSHPEVNMVIAGPRTPDELTQCLEGADAEHFAPEKMNEVAEIQQEITA